MNFLPAMTLLEYFCMTRPKKEFKGKRTKNEALFLNTKFGKIKNQHAKNNHKGPIAKCEGNCIFC